jgi:iron complex outermembrane receptor protein
MVAPFRFQFTNGMRGEIYGLELWGAWQAAPWWRLRGGYTRLHRDLYPIPGHVELPQPGNQGNDPAWHGSIHTFLDLPEGFELNGCARWVAELPAPAVPSYFTFDLGAAWRWKGLEAALVGRNLAGSRHPEFRLLVTEEAQGIPRSILARVSWRI